MKFDGRTATRFVVTLVLLLLAGAMLGTSVAQSELRVGVSQIPHNPDPTFDSLSLSQTIYRAMYEGLVSIDGEGREQPMLAESWSVIDDTTWELALRRGVKFHNGEEFTSADVVFTLNRVLDPETSAAWRSRISPISSVVAVDDYTVRIVTSAPFATLLKGLAIVYMLPVSEYSDGIGRNYLAEPVGTGPFRFDSWQGDQYITIERFDDYWGNQPLIDQITYREIPESSSRIAGLRAGELDLIYEVPAESTGVLESNGFNVHSISLGQSMVIVLAGTRGGPLDDRRVRQAINYAIDVELIRETIMQGHGGPLNGQIVGPDGFGHNPDITPYAFDPERARELLAEAGFA